MALWPVFGLVACFNVQSQPASCEPALEPLEGGLHFGTASPDAASACTSAGGRCTVSHCSAGEHVDNSFQCADWQNTCCLRTVPEASTGDAPEGASDAAEAGTDAAGDAAASDAGAEAGGDAAEAADAGD